MSKCLKPVWPNDEICCLQTIATMMACCAEPKTNPLAPLSENGEAPLWKAVPNLKLRPNRLKRRKSRKNKYRRRDSNPHWINSNRILSPARLPIPPLRQPLQANH